MDTTWRWRWRKWRWTDKCSTDTNNIFSKSRASKYSYDQIVRSILFHLFSLSSKLVHNGLFYCLQCKQFDQDEANIRVE